MHPFSATIDFWQFLCVLTLFLISNIFVDNAFKSHLLKVALYVTVGRRQLKVVDFRFFLFTVDF